MSFDTSTDHTFALLCSRHAKWNAFGPDSARDRHRCVVREDGKGEVVIAGLQEKEAMDAEGLEAFIADGNRNRTTHATESNDQSSRWVQEARRKCRLAWGICWKRFGMIIVVGGAFVVEKARVG